MSGVVQVLVTGYLVSLGVALVLLGLVVAAQNLRRLADGLTERAHPPRTRRARVAPAARVRSGHV